MTRSLPCLVLVLGALLAHAGPASAQPVKLATDWDETFAEAKRRNIPVVFFLGRDKKTPWVQQFTVPALAAFLNDRALVIVGHRGGEHAPETVVDPKTKKETLLCPIYKQFHCSVHKAFHDDYAGNFDYKELPAGFILRPDESTASEGVAELSVKKLMAKINDAQFALGDGVFKSEILKLEKKLSKGDEKLDKSKLKAARKIYEKPLKDAKLKAHLKTIVEDRLKKLDAKALEIIEAAKTLEAKRRHEELKRIAREMKGRAPAEAAEKVLAEVEGG